MSITVPVTSSPAAELENSNSFRTLLEGQRSQCLDEQAATVDALRDAPDDTVLRARRGSIATTMEQIDAALERLALGTYGSCSGCGRAIPAERLEIRPHTPTCVACS